jgi:hypothetical protein
MTGAQNMADTMLHRRPPMPASEARAVVTEMRRKTSKRSAARLLTLALGPLGNLSDEARAVYRAELERITA